MSDLVLVVNRDAEVRTAIGTALTAAGFGVVKARGANDAIALLECNAFALVVLDANKPGECAMLHTWLRLHSSTPVLLLSQQDAQADIVFKLATSRKHCMMKPLDPRLLVVRVNELLHSARSSAKPAISVGDATLDEEERCLAVSDHRLLLAPLEVAVVRILMTNAGQYVSVRRLLGQVWGQSGDTKRTFLKQVIYRLRCKLDRAGLSSLLKSSRRAGYCWDTTFDAGVSRASDGNRTSRAT